MYWGRPYTPAMPDEFEGQRVTVMGLGRFGGGVGVARFLAARGADVLVTDQSSADKLADSVAQLQPLIDAGQVTLRLGEHNVSDFTTCDRVVVNPAVPPGNRFIRAAEAAGIPVTTEVRLLVERLPNRLRTIGVTGSAGKSTVTAMIGHVLGKVLGVGGWGLGQGDSTPNPQSPTPNPRVWVGGNIGGSLLERIDEIGPEDWVVLELSSFMLERLRADEATGFPGWSPHIAVVTNISENHLDWHGSMEAYSEAKSVVVKYQEPRDKAFLQAAANDWPVPAGVEVIGLREGRGKPIPWLTVVGAHNSENARLAAMVGDAIALGHGNQVLQRLADFPGLPHRLQFVGEYAGVKFYNDSKCTTPGAARLAVEAFTETRTTETGTDPVSEKKGRPRFVHLILGGYDKGSDLASLAGLARAQCKAVYTIGETGEGAALAAEAASPRDADGRASGGAEVVRCGTLERAVEEMRCRVGSGDVVLLSPGCASWDQFDNYERRGERFIELVRKTFGESAGP